MNWRFVLQSVLQTNSFSFYWIVIRKLIYMKFFFFTNSLAIVQIQIWIKWNYFYCGISYFVQIIKISDDSIYMYNQPSNLEDCSIVGWVTFWGSFDPQVVVLTVVNYNKDCTEECSSGEGRISDIFRWSCCSYHSLGLLNVEGGIAMND